VSACVLVNRRIVDTKELNLDLLDENIPGIVISQGKYFCDSSALV